MNDGTDVRKLSVNNVTKLTNYKLCMHYDVFGLHYTPFEFCANSKNMYSTNCTIIILFIT